MFSATELQQLPQDRRNMQKTKPRASTVSVHGSTAFSQLFSQDGSRVNVSSLPRLTSPGDSNGGGATRQGPAALLANTAFVLDIQDGQETAKRPPHQETTRTPSGQHQKIIKKTTYDEHCGQDDHDEAMLAQRIQGFGNVNPPPLEEETGATVAKKALGRLGDMVGEEVMLTVEDFKEKGAVGAVKDAVADAGDILIDGVSGIIGWIRGEPPAEEESEKAEDATKALAYGPNGAAYGISQASPTGGINAVWVMPEEADPQAMAQLAAQQGGRAVNDPRVPKNIQPYQPPAGSRAAPPPTSFNQPMQVPGGPVIAPYTPAPAGPSHRPPFVPGSEQ
ncbi:hypothetical protein AK812_SmicGene12012 [Symbiodinium microadriaticum]|uniref:Uncharacterized protein n=2 Tax=Symbiodinium TaxID=2949 RepID=A0A1Q9EBU6_SYMMI|nr:hypothetical protein AK812_SmicGene12012 [Symbiodinium microadriaticum]